MQCISSLNQFRCLQRLRLHWLQVRINRLYVFCKVRLFCTYVKNILTRNTLHVNVKVSINMPRHHVNLSPSFCFFLEGTFVTDFRRWRQSESQQAETRTTTVTNYPLAALRLADLSSLLPAGINQVSYVIAPLEMETIMEVIKTNYCLAISLPLVNFITLRRERRNYFLP